jgi:hypothetical protein
MAGRDVNIDFVYKHVSVGTPRRFSPATGV